MNFKTQDLIVHSETRKYGFRVHRMMRWDRVTVGVVAQVSKITVSC